MISRRSFAAVNSVHSLARPRTAMKIMLRFLSSLGISDCHIISSASLDFIWLAISLADRFREFTANQT
jgi:hypothetical protein